MKFDQLLEIDRKAEEGAWVDNLSHLNGVSVKVRGQMNSQHETLFTELWGKVPPEKREDQALNEEIEKECLKKTILLDWAGIEDYPCTPENIEKALEIRTFRQAIVTASRLVATRGRETLESDAKNL